MKRGCSLHCGPFFIFPPGAFGTGSYMVHFQANLLQEKKTNTNLTFLYYFCTFVLI
ncbi:hypothetical protein DSECCO2_322550 [anaerobic digester metagenome]